jgi:pimeloyl-ACP methyl ester carboxylesterase
MARRGRRRSELRAAEAGGLLAYSYRQDQLEDALRTGRDAKRLELYFGEARYRELRALAQEAPARAVRGAPRVLVLPGIMGSTLRRRRVVLDDVLWFDPLDIAAGQLVKLALGDGPARFAALGLIPLAYVALTLRLKIAGFDVGSHAYDWRQSLDTLGRELAGRLRRERAAEVHLVAHSMGGLVARAAIAEGAPKLARLVMLGTPNHGSFAPVQALRAVHPVVRQVALLDAVHSAEALVSTTFSTFPGLYQLLPAPAKWSDIDLFDGAAWPTRGPRPRQDLLDGVRRVQSMLAPADERFFLIAGMNQETVTDLRLAGGEFVYDHSIEGDGTVPLAFAELAGARTWYVEEAHGSLPVSPVVARAVIDLIESGKTGVLPDRWAPLRRAPTRSLRDGELRVDPFGGRRAGELTPGEIRRMLEPLLSADARDAGPGAPVAAAVTMPGDLEALQQVVVGRRRQHRIDVRLALGSITEIDARASVLGLFRNVAPSGAALALDARLGGAISEFSARRMFSGNAGEVFVLPTGRHPLRADFIIFAGLGHFDRFTPETCRGPRRRAGGSATSSVRIPA